jgi:hypothetical protein
LQDPLVVIGDAIGGGLRENFSSRLAQNLGTRHSKSRLGDAVDQEITAIARILDRNLCRDVVDDLQQEGMIAVAFLFKVSTLGNVLHGRDPPALRQRSIDDMHGAPVGGFEDAVGHIALDDVARDG